MLRIRLKLFCIVCYVQSVLTFANKAENKQIIFCMVFKINDKFQTVFYIKDLLHM